MNEQDFGKLVDDYCDALNDSWEYYDQDEHIEGGHGIRYRKIDAARLALESAFAELLKERDAACEETRNGEQQKEMP